MRCSPNPPPNKVDPPEAEPKFFAFFANFFDFLHVLMHFSLMKMHFYAALCAATASILWTLRSKLHSQIALRALNFPRETVNEKPRAALRGSVLKTRGSYCVPPRGGATARLLTPPPFARHRHAATCSHRHLPPATCGKPQH